MSLSERLLKARAERPDRGPVDLEDTREMPAVASDPMQDVKRRIHEVLLASLGPKLSQLSPEQIEMRVRKKVKEVLEGEQHPLSSAERQQLVRESVDDILGYGPLEPLLQDPSVTEVMANGSEGIWVERAGQLHLTDVRFVNDDHLRRVIDKIVSRVGRRVDEAQPYVDARLPDGSRVNAIIPPIAIDGPMLTIRKFATEPFRVDDLVSFGTVSSRVATFLEACVRGRLNILVSGGTGAGKTTTLNVLSAFIPAGERIVTIEDAAELRLQQPHVGRLESRLPNTEGRGQVTIRDLVRNALRMRPDRIVVGEVRGGEALDMLQAMNTGHDGSISTIHANSPRDVLSRLETMVLMAGMDLPIRAIREQIAAGVQLVVHQSRLRDGSRRVTHVTEVVGMEGDVITLQDIYLFDYGMGIGESDRFLGRIKPTGIRPVFAQRLRDVGIDLPGDLFEPEAPSRGRSR